MASNNHQYKTHRQNPQTPHRALCGLFLAGQHPPHTARSDEVTCGQCLELQKRPEYSTA